MSAIGPPKVLFKGRSIGMLLLVAAQALIGVVHTFFGFWLLSASSASPRGIGSFGLDVYSVYTVAFGLLTLCLAMPLWWQKSWGWWSTIGVLAFVVVADSLTLLNLPSVPGIPKVAGFGEISYSIIVIVYLLQPHVRAAFKISSRFPRTQLHPT